jgi:mutator protein MutT
LIEVVGAIILDDSRVLLAQRKQDALQGLLWEFPGGKVEPGEAPQDALVREIQEELGVRIEVLDLFAENAFDYGERRIRLSCYRCRLLEKDLRTLDCAAFRWVDKKNLFDFPLAPADVPIAEKLISIL